ncbi:hypothetical protein [Flammeovirga kamogawensis]|uniref:Peptidylprolyl isomerase n=1 Tax=Flammeovirga kamogawensis TaxID=373891 RepID=A0ABX8GSA1_9BACT|nr:hypothetical protein [Flammeovirga kamogawensis]MBB6461384.1 hypothetical protein [Flammeovirga kamogawensis]QWG06284.1 hypothetical protein KM029_13180 [Flammeovirga kamogawensis]TRX68113.1 hypothetical protein EO216_08195 [Flammeovirga kamogawensis]
MRNLLSNLLLFFTIISFASCNSNDIVEPNFPTQDAIDYHYYITTSGRTENKQLVNVYNTEKSEKLEDLKLFSIGENQLISVYLQDGNKIDITTETEGGNLYDIIYAYGISIEDLGYHVKRYFDKNDDAIFLKTSIKVVHEIITD